MDLDLAFWLAIAAVYLFQFFLGKKKKENLGSPVPNSDSTGEPESFGDALAEISRMLGGEPPKEEKMEPASFPMQSPAKRDNAVIHSKRSVLQAPSSRLAMSPANRDTVVSKPAYFDDSFEKKDYVAFHSPIISHVPTPIAALPAKLPRRSLFNEVNRDIHNLATAQEALVLADVLGPPVSKKPPGRRR